MWVVGRGHAWMLMEGLEKYGALSVKLSDQRGRQPFQMMSVFLSTGLFVEERLEFGRLHCLLAHREGKGDLFRRRERRHEERCRRTGDGHGLRPRRIAAREWSGSRVSAYVQDREPGRANGFHG